MRAPLDLAKSSPGAVEAVVAAEDVAEAVEAVEAVEAAEVAEGAEVADARSTLVQSVLRPETGLACLALISPGGQPNRARRP